MSFDLNIGIGGHIDHHERHDHDHHHGHDNMGMEHGHYGHGGIVDDHHGDPMFPPHIDMVPEGHHGGGGMYPTATWRPPHHNDPLFPAHVDAGGGRPYMHREHSYHGRRYSGGHDFGAGGYPGHSLHDRPPPAWQQHRPGGVTVTVPVDDGYGGRPHYGPGYVQPVTVSTRQPDGYECPFCREPIPLGTGRGVHMCAKCGNDVAVHGGPQMRIALFACLGVVFFIASLPAAGIAYAVTDNGYVATVGIVPLAIGLALIAYVIVLARKPAAVEVFNEPEPEPEAPKPPQQPAATSGALSPPYPMGQGTQGASGGGGYHTLGTSGASGGGEQKY